MLIFFGYSNSWQVNESFESCCHRDHLEEIYYSSFVKLSLVLNICAAFKSTLQT
jgi:hypothetical protein